VHAKICLVVKRTTGGLRRYVHLGTGNYNERTARGYTDFSLMTTSPAIAEDASAFFSSLTGYSDPPRLKKLVMAPTGLRQRFIKLIDREQRRAVEGQPAEIIAKMNSLIDPEIIARLYQASQAGVRIRLNVRGVCALRPGVSGVSDNIAVVSIIDRFLEHSRIYYFLNGGDDDVYLAIPLHKGQLSCRELMNGELLLNPVKADRAIRIDDIESPYSQIPSLRKIIYARGMAAPVEPPAAGLDNVHLMPSGTEEPSRK